MSMRADLVDIFQNSVNTVGINEDNAAYLFASVISALEWDFDQVDYASPNWQAEEHDAAKAELFGNKKAA